MGRVLKILAWAAGTIIAVPLVVVAIVVIGGNTGKGRAIIERLASQVSGGQLALQGLSGRFPNSLHLARLELRDAQGVWLTADNVTLDWSALRLLSATIDVHQLLAQQVSVARFPVSSSSESSSSPALRVTIDKLAIDRLDLAAPVAGVPATVAVNGSLQLAAADQGKLGLALERLDRPGRYDIDAAMTPDSIDAKLNATEPAQGLIAEMAHLPDIGPLSIAATVTGPRKALRTDLAAQLGALRADGHGTIDLVDKAVDLDTTASSPAMAPRPDLSWRTAQLDAHIHGSFSRPDATGRLEIDDLTAAGGAVRQATVDLAGNSGTLDLTAGFSGVRLPGSYPDLLAAAPVTIRAEATLDTPARPVVFTLSHPLITVSGRAETGTAMTAAVTITLPALQPLAAAMGQDLQGSARLGANLSAANNVTNATVNGTVNLTGGNAMANALLGGDSTIDLAARQENGTVTLDHAVIDGKGLRLSANGTVAGDTLAFDWGVTLANLADIVPTISGPLTVAGQLHGPKTDLAATLSGHGTLAARGFPAAPIDLALSATGLPASPAGHLDLHGRFANAPVDLAADLQQGADRALQLTIARAAWKSVNAEGALRVPAGSVFPLGQMQLRVGNLGDFTPIVGKPVSGSIGATLRTTQSGARTQARLQLDARRVGMGPDSIDRIAVDATVTDPTTTPAIAAQLAATGLSASGIGGEAKLTANGPLDGLRLHLNADLATSGGPAQITAAAIARGPQKRLDLTSFNAAYKGQTARLLAPARIDFATGLALDQLRLGVGAATVAIAGRVSPALGLTVSIRNLTPQLVKPFDPALNAAGTVSMDARLGGTLAAPTGTLQLTGRGLRLDGGPGGGVPAASLDTTAQLRGRSAQVSLRLNAGADAQLRAQGTIPLDLAQPVDLRTNGSINLAMLNPILTASGQSARGLITLDLGVDGTVHAPRATGSLRLVNVAFQDYVAGLDLTAINGTILAAGDTLRIAQMIGHAGNGTIGVAGTVSLLSPMPIDLTITARNARPIASDILTAVLSADLTLRGNVGGMLTVGGNVDVSRADINIPDSFPQSVAVLDVRRAGQAPPPPPNPLVIGLDLTVNAPQQVFVRGHGLDAEMGGRLGLQGNSTAPQIAGGFDLRRGTFSLAGQTLTFTKGRVGFDGYGLSERLNPTINFEADSTSNGVTATLTITGHADQPKIQLTSTPQLPQDEILAQLLFGESVKQLSPIQLVEIAQGIAQITGVGSGINPLARIRQGLGLDRLAVSGASGSSTGATIEAGKYVANGVYVGTRQGTSGGTQAQVQIDLTQHLKLLTQLGTGGGVPATGITPQNDPGSSVGLTYQFEY